MATMPDGQTHFCDPLELLHRTRGADPASAWNLLDATFTRTGFPHSFYAFGVPMTSRQPLLDKIKRGMFGTGRFVDDFFSEFVKRPELLAVEPVAPHCKATLRPFVWSRDELKAREGSGLGLVYEFGITAFMVFPLRNGDATHYGNFTVFCSDARHRSWLRHAQRFAPLLHVTAQYFYDRLAGDSDKLVGSASGIVLSPRQRECLLWASCGLVTKQIAERLKLSEAVVNEYVLAAKRKLGCATRAQAVARAMALGLLAPSAGERAFIEASAIRDRYRNP